MKAFIFFLLAINLLQAHQFYDCSQENKSLIFYHVSVWNPDSNSELQFLIQGQALAEFYTDQVQIRVYGGAPEFKILRTERFSYFPFSFFNGAYKVQIDFQDTNDNAVGCAYFNYYQGKTLE